MASVYIAEIHFLLPKILLLPCLSDFGQLYFSLTNPAAAVVYEYYYQLQIIGCQNGFRVLCN